MRNSEDFGARIKENEASDREIWLWRVKQSFHKVLGSICGIFEWLEVLV
jgi:hypothetical protein